MPKEDTINPLFLPYDMKDEDLESIVFYVPTIYSDKVKVHDWQRKTLAEPRDNKDLFPPKGNLHGSTYRRIGPNDEGTGVSETHTMLSQIELRDEYKPMRYSRRSLLTMQTLALAEEDYEEKDLQLEDLLTDSIATRYLDYRTTMDSDFRSPHPRRPTSPPPSPPPEPWLLNRRTVGYNLHALENRPGPHTFLDDNMDLHQRIAELKMKRGKLCEMVMKDKEQRA